VKLDAGVPVTALRVVNHQATVAQPKPNEAAITLDPADSIPNKDFVLRYHVVGNKPQMAMLAHCRDSGDGYFLLMMQPQVEGELPKAPPREIVFLVDVSGSMQGEPTAKNKQIMREFFKHAQPDDTFNVVTFYSEAQKLFPKAVPATAANTTKALQFVDSMTAGGGTEMLQGVKKALEDPVDPRRIRIVVMLTDGFIGNEAEIIEEVGNQCGDSIRFWTLGIGASPNRFLLDGVAKMGGGGSEVVELKTDPGKLVANIVERIHRAQLAHINIDWNGLQVKDVYPKRIPELWPGRPVILVGRYTEGGETEIELRGTAEGKDVTWPLRVNLPETQAMEHDVLAGVWARKKIEDLTFQMGNGEQPKLKEQITQLALDYRIMSKYTSFVAVDEKDAPPPGKYAPPRRVAVPVPLPDGISHDGIFGSADGPATTTNTQYIGGGGGDPWITVSAPADARRVVAIFPNGDAKPLAFVPKKGVWSTRFDFPLGTATGPYTVTIVVVYRDGSRARFLLTYQNLLGGKLQARTASITAKPGQAVTLAVEGTGIQRAVAVAPWGERVTLAPDAGARWQGTLTVPTAWLPGESAITVVLLDGAHNRTEITVDLTVE
jgi:Ca-activated chloride channel family protein